MALDPKTYPVEKKTLYVPPLQEVADILNNGLKNNFAEVIVEVVDSPDFTQEPFRLASKGLGGNTKLVDIGSTSYFVPLIQRDKVYELKDIVKLTESNPAFIIGAGAGPHPYVGVNSDGLWNLNIVNGNVEQHSQISKVDENDQENIIHEILPNSESRLSTLANLFISEGKQGKVLKVYAKKRIGSDDFIASIRKTLEVAYKDKLVGLGGTFILKEGKVRQHVLPDFSKTPLRSQEELNNWLRFYNMSAPLVAVGTLINGDGGLDLRGQHFHSSSNLEAGHYLIDVTPDSVEYLGYFNLGQEVYRVDKPAKRFSWS